MTGENLRVLDMAPEVPLLHRIEPIVTPDRYELGAHRMRVPGGWLYWLDNGGSPISSFVPDPPPTVVIGAGVPDTVTAEPAGNLRVQLCQVAGAADVSSTEGGAHPTAS